MPLLALAAVVAIVAGVVAWWYGLREERVRGRGIAALLRAAALLVLLSAPWMPALRDGIEDQPRTAILVDRSLSMSYPVAATGDITRIQAARGVAADLFRSRRSPTIWAFARAARPIELEDLDAIEASGDVSLVVDAIERARAAGADSLVLLTDGELGDREAGRRLAEQLGIPLREVVVAEHVDRIGIRTLSAPRTVTSGDTLEVRAEIIATGRPGDPARVSLAFGREVSAATTVELPAAGRTIETVFRVPAESSSDSIEWRPLDVRVEGLVAPWDAAARSRVWVGVSPEPTGAVMVSVDPDWEARYLSPVLDRTMPGGARVYLRVDEGTYVRAGLRPVGGVSETSVRRAAETATLLVVQGSPGSLPPWLESAARRRPAVMYLVRGTGPVPGTGVSVEEALPGEWYVGPSPPPGPVSPQLIGVDPVDLPPLSRLFRSRGSSGGSVLSARRDRRGAARPIAVIGESEGRRWAIVHGEGAWRWAARGDQGLALYRGLFAGMTRWLVERTAPRPVQLSEPFFRARDSVRWRTAPGVRDLSIRLEDASGALVWSYATSDSTTSITGPPLEQGDARFVATGTSGGTSFRIGRPFHANAGAERLPNPVGSRLDVRPEAAAKKDAAAGSVPPVWPFAVAIALLCAEWLWRRKVGLR